MEPAVFACSRGFLVVSYSLPEATVAYFWVGSCIARKSYECAQPGNGVRRVECALPCLRGTHGSKRWGMPARKPCVLNPGHDPHLFVNIGSFRK